MTEGARALPRLVAVAVVYVLATFAVRAETPPWPHELSDLRVDPEVVWGRLPNGVRYAVRPNAHPPAHASLRLIVLAGTVHENDGQRGYAHFVEHLAFHGTRSFPGQSLHAMLQRQGIARGPDVNAYTHADRTVYRLDLPSNDPARIRLGLQVLREFADGLTFDADDIRREGNVILIEKSMRNDRSERSDNALMRFLFPRSRLADTNGYGTEESVRTATAERLRDFYRTWYRPDNLVVVAVGAFPTDSVAREIEIAFAGIPEPDTPRPAVAFGPIENPRELRVGVQTGTPGSDLVRFTLSSLAPTAPTDTHASLKELLQATVGFEIVNRRLEAAKLAHAPHIGAANLHLEAGAFYRKAQLRVDGRRSHWRRALQLLEQELRRALEHGFAPAEIVEARLKIGTLIGYSAATETTRFSDSQADALVETIAENRVFMATEDLARLSQEVLGAATPEACLQAFRRVWAPGQPQLFAVGDFGVARPAEEIVEAFHRSAGKRLKPAVSPAPVHFAYTEFGAPCPVVARSHIADLDIHCVEFANGVRLNLKRTPYEANRIVYGAKLATGSADEPRYFPGLRYFADHALGPLGLGRHDQSALDRLSAGHLATLSFNAGEDAFYISGFSSATSAERLLQLLTAQLADPGWRTDQIDMVRHRVASRIDDLTSHATNHVGSLRHGLIAGGDTRYALPTIAQLTRYSVVDLRRWLDPHLRRGPLEVGIVGDFDVDAMIRLAARTIGCLPRRNGANNKLRPVRFVDLLPTTAVTVPTSTRHGAVQLVWSVPLARNARTEHQLELLGEVLRNRLVVHIRGKLGATYSAGCHVWWSDVQRDRGYLIASLNCAAGDVARVAEASRTIADDLAREGVTAEEFERARQPRLQTAPEQLLTNAYWLSSAVAAAQSRPDQLELPRQRLQLLAEISGAELSPIAAAVLPAARASILSVAPQPE